MKTPLLLPALLLLAACSSPPVHRPLPAPPPATDAMPFPPNAPRPELTLTSGDLIRISVFQQPDLDLETRIPDGGSVSFPLIGPVQAAGKSSSELETTIRERLAKDYLQSPSVTVTVKEFTKRKVFIVGGVAKPDGYELAPDARLTVLQLIAAAGGFTDRASKDVVQVIRRQGAAGRVVLLLPLAEVERRLAAGKADADLDLWPDDLVVVPASLRVAYVLGAVQKPGSVELPANTRLTVSMAVSYAGSYTKFASTGNIQVLRRNAAGVAQHLPVDLDAVLDGRLELDIALQPGDVVWVPERGIF
jgi:polysaccharide export outer membrane protein